MSGSPLSPWAQVTDALSVTIRLAKQLNCSVPSDLSQKHPETIACLRNVTARQLVDAVMPRYKFASLFGPSVDGIVIQENFKERLSQAQNEGRIQLMFGVTEGDAYPELTSSQGKSGITLSERNRIFRTLVRNTFRHHLQEIYLTIAKEYTDWEKPTQNPFQIRDWTLDALSDGGFVAPSVKYANLFGRETPSFMYVFSHHDQRHQKPGSVFHSEIPLLFGAPFQDNQFFSVSSPSSLSFHFRSPSPNYLSSLASHSFTESSTSSGLISQPIVRTWTNFSKSDAIVCEYLMRYWTNFAKSGHPDHPSDTRPSLEYGERSNYKNVTWEEYDQVMEKYLEISSRPRILDHYRAHKVALWNWLLPELEDAGSKYPDTDSEKWHTSDDRKYFIGPVKPLDPFRFLHPTKYSPTLNVLSSPSSVLNGYLAPNVSAAQGSLNLDMNVTKPSNLDKGNPLLDYTTALTLTVSIGLSLLVLNVILFAALVYKKDRSHTNSKMNYDSVSALPLCTVDSGMRSTPTPHEMLTPPGNIIQSSSSPDHQCTELHTFPTAPDIGDRSTEVSFHNSNSIHSGIAQPTSHFIPPPPLLTNTPPPTTLGSETVEGATCGQSRCLPDMGHMSYNDVIANYTIDSPSQYTIDIGDKTYTTRNVSPNYIDESIQSGYRVEHYGGTQEYTKGQPCADSKSCTHSSVNKPCQSEEFCQTLTQYSAAEQCTDSHSKLSSVSCQFGLEKDKDSLFYSESSFLDKAHGSSGPIHIVKSLNIGTLKMPRSDNDSELTLKKTQHPLRGAALPSYATLPRKDLSK